MIMRAKISALRISGCGAYSRAALINLFCPRCGAYSRAALNRVNTVGTHCVDVGSALKNNMVQASLVFDEVLSLPSISRSRCLINREILQKFKI